MNAFQVINPATESLIAEYAADDPADVARKLASAARAFQDWKSTSFDERSRLLRQVAGVLRTRAGELSGLMAREMGKPLADGREEIEKCARGCEFFAANGQAFLAPRSISSDADVSLVQCEPLGVILAIMPWNFPFWQVFRFAAPALMAGNVALLKHAPNVSGCALAIHQVFVEAGLPPGAFGVLLIDVPETTQLIGHRDIAAVTLTGSERAGQSVAAAAGAALKPAVLELGGSDPFIILPDADAQTVARAAASARCVNAGQSCIAAKRFIVVGERPDFVSAFAAALQSIRVGDPLDSQTQIGPLARLDLLENLQDQVDRSVAAGARLVTGGRRLPRPGFFYAPTLLADARPGMAVCDEETFGPVAALLQARDVDHAIELANATRFGLGASLWTADADKARRQIAPRLNAGMVFINGPVKSDPALPFGGIRHSGYGRELSIEGIRSFVNLKTVWMKARPAS